MKNRIYSLLLLSLCSFCFFAVTSCNDDNDDDDFAGSSKPYCTCIGRDDYGNTATDVVYLSEWGAKNCSELARILARNTHNVTFSCK